jgi:hypothetical protein
MGEAELPPLPVPVLFLSGTAPPIEDQMRSYARIAVAAAQAPLIAEIERLRADAMRYRWLRDTGDANWAPMGKRTGVRHSHEIDQAIDSAISASKDTTP